MGQSFNTDSTVAVWPNYLAPGQRNDSETSLHEQAENRSDSSGFKHWILFQHTFPVVVPEDVEGVQQVIVVVFGEVNRAGASFQYADNLYNRTQKGSFIR